MIRIGVVGLGFMGVTHLKSYRQVPGAEVVAVCDAYRLPADGDLSKIAGNIGGADPLRLDWDKIRGYTKFETMLAETAVDVVDICVPTKTHPDLAIAALAAGKHVVCEKPMARTAALARTMVAAAERSPGVFMPAMCMRFWPEWRWVKEAIGDGRFGKAQAARFRRVSEPPAWGREVYFQGQESGGALLDLHIHDSDFVQYCFGRPTKVFSMGLSRYSGAVDHVVTQYQVASGAVVSAEGSWLMSEGHGFSMAYTIIFERATVDCDSGRGADALRLFEPGQKPRTISVEGQDGYVGELRHLIAAVTAGQKPTWVTARDGLSAVEICEAEERSIQTGAVIELAPTA